MRLVGVPRPKERKQSSVRRPSAFRLVTKMASSFTTRLGTLNRDVVSILHIPKPMSSSAARLWQGPSPSQKRIPEALLESWEQLQHATGSSGLAWLCSFLFPWAVPGEPAYSGAHSPHGHFIPWILKAGTTQPHTGQGPSMSSPWYRAKGSSLARCTCRSSVPRTQTSRKLLKELEFWAVYSPHCKSLCTTWSKLSWRRAYRATPFNFPQKESLSQHVISLFLLLRSTPCPTACTSPYPEKPTPKRLRFKTLQFPLPAHFCLWPKSD